MSSLQHCYNDGLRTNPTLVGKASYAIVIAVDGTVRSVEVEHDASLSRDVIECTKEQILGWVFPMNGATTGADVRSPSSSADDAAGH